MIRRFLAKFFTHQVVMQSQLLQHLNLSLKSGVLHIVPVLHWRLPFGVVEGSVVGWAPMWCSQLVQRQEFGEDVETSLLVGGRAPNCSGL